MQADVMHFAPANYLQVIPIVTERIVALISTASNMIAKRIALWLFVVAPGVRNIPFAMEAMPIQNRMFKPGAWHQHS
jgi:hypothetical protein